MQERTSYRDGQARQVERYTAWVKEQGQHGRPPEELPTQLDTLLRPEQQERLRWLRANVYPDGRILSVGCNIGYDLAFCAQPPNVARAPDMGIDISEPCILVASTLAAARIFITRDARDFAFMLVPKSFDTIMCCEMLEHLAWPNDVDQVLHQINIVGPRRILITVPAPDAPDAENKKHQWICDDDHLEHILNVLRGMSPETITIRRELGPGFIGICVNTTKEERA